MNSLDVMIQPEKTKATEIVIKTQRKNFCEFTLFYLESLRPPAFGPTFYPIFLQVVASDSYFSSIKGMFKIWSWGALIPFFWNSTQALV